LLLLLRLRLPCLPRQHLPIVELVLGRLEFPGPVRCFYLLDDFHSSGRISGHQRIPLGVERTVIAGNPDQAHISTSHVERQNLTMRMSMRRFTRLTNAFSKKLENLRAAVALHFAHYNLVRLHKTLRVTPAMAAGVTDRLWSIEDLVDRTSN
jgi:hypothetical protein